MKKYLFGRIIYLNQKVYRLFTSIFGVGEHGARYLIAKYGIRAHAHIVKNKFEKRFFDVEEVVHNDFVSPHILQKIYARSMQENRRYKSYKAIRRRQGLPFSGQRTHSNAKTTRKLYRSQKLIYNLARAGAVGAKRKGGKK